MIFVSPAILLCVLSIWKLSFLQFRKFYSFFPPLTVGSPTSVSSFSNSCLIFICALWLFLFIFLICFLSAAFCVNSQFKFVVTNFLLYPWARPLTSRLTCLTSLPSPFPSHPRPQQHLLAGREDPGPGRKSHGLHSSLEVILVFWIFNLNDSPRPRIYYWTSFISICSWCIFVWFVL